MQQIKKKENDMKKLGFGLMRLPLTDASDPASIDVEQVKKMVDIFIEKGFTYFDTAWMYCGFQSESVAKKALVERYPRERYQLATKNAAWIGCETKEQAYAQFEESLARTKAGYFDFLSVT